MEQAPENASFIFRKKYGRTISGKKKTFVFSVLQWGRAFTILVSFSFYFIGFSPIFIKHLSTSLASKIEFF